MNNKIFEYTVIMTIHAQSDQKQTVKIPKAYRLFFQFSNVRFITGIIPYNLKVIVRKSIMHICHPSSASQQNVRCTETTDTSQTTVKDNGSLQVSYRIQSTRREQLHVIRRQIKWLWRQNGRKPSQQGSILLNSSRKRCIRY